jgi:hypothetical protein
MIFKEYFMKILLLASLFLFSATGFSASKDHKSHMDHMDHMDYMEMEKKMDNMSFDDAKKMKMDMLDEMTSMHDKERACLNDAKDKTALKTCMKEAWTAHKDMKTKMKDKMNAKADTSSTKETK